MAKSLGESERKGNLNDLSKEWFVKQMKKEQMIVRGHLGFGIEGEHALNPEVHIDLSTSHSSGIWGGVALRGHSGELKPLEIQVFPAPLGEDEPRAEKAWVETLLRWDRQPGIHSMWRQDALVLCTARARYGDEPIEPCHQLVLQYMMALQGMLHVWSSEAPTVPTRTLCDALAHRVAGYVRAQNRVLDRQVGVPSRGRLFLPRRAPGIIIVAYLLRH